jgi:hypothetical protein
LLTRSTIPQSVATTSPSWSDVPCPLHNTKPISRTRTGANWEGSEEGESVLEDVVLLVDGDGVRDGDGGGRRGGGREGLELVERRLEADPLGLVQREV